MTITVLFFGATADAVGTRSREMRSESAVAKDIVDRLVKEHPALSRHKLLFAVNQEYVASDTPLKNGDELAIFTAVSGG